MFGKTKCNFCGSKISKKYQFCPNCGRSAKEKSDNQFFQPTFKLGFPFDTLIKHMSKQIESQFKEIDKGIGEMNFDEKKVQKMPMQGLSISISSANNGQPVIKVRSLGDKTPIELKAMQTAKPGKQVRQIALPQKQFSEEESEKLSKLPKEEPKTSIRRLTDKIVYEIEIPGVKKENVIISKLQNSIEIKAFAKDKAFFKLIPISLPIIKSQIKEGKLVLEFSP